MAFLAVLAWLLATCLVALSPLLYFVAGASDSATEAARVQFAAVPLVVAWLVLVLAFGLARRRRGLPMGAVAGPAAMRALLLIAFAGAVLALAHHLGSTVAFEGDTAWTLFWTVTVVAWVGLSAAGGLLSGAGR
jgi:hypothetical protein